MRRHEWQDWALLMALTVMWGTAFTLTKVAVTDLSPTLVVGARLVIGALVLFAAIALMRRRLPSGRRAWLFFLSIGAIGNAIPFWLISWGQQAIDSGQAGILMAFMPLITLVLSHYLLPDESMSAARIVGFMLGFAGVTVLMGPEALFNAGRPDGAFVAKLAVLGGAVCYAISAILARLRPAGDATGTAAATTLIAAALTLPWLALEAKGPVAGIMGAPAGAWLALLALGVFSTAIAAVIYFRLVKSAGPAFVSQLNYLIPLWAVVIGVLFLGEQPTPSQGYALVLILGGVYVSQRRSPAERPVGGHSGDEAADSLPADRDAAGLAPIRVRVGTGPQPYRKD